MIQNLSGIGLEDASLFGGKAAALGEMTRRGIPVPAGAALSVDLFQKYLRHNRIDFDPARLPAVNERVQGAMLTGAFPPEDERALRALFRRLYEAPGEGLVARSSALCEDADRTSFAGIFETYADLHSPEDLIQAVKKCYASLVSDKALEYALRRGVPLARFAMGVVVQTFVRGRPSGVLFTADPVVFDPDATVINWVDDVCAAFVSGAAASRRLVIRRGPGASGADEGLTARRLAALITLGEECDRIFGPRRDIEWTFAGETLYALQCRPITAWKDKNFPIAWENDEEKNHTWHKEYGPVTVWEREVAFAAMESENQGAFETGLEWFYGEGTCQNGYLYWRRKEVPGAARKRDEYYAVNVAGLAKEGKNIFTDVHLPAIQAAYADLEKRLRRDMTDEELADFLDRSFRSMLDIGGRHWRVVQGCLYEWDLERFRELHGLGTAEIMLLLEQDTWLTRYRDGIVRLARAVKADPVLLALFREHSSPAVIDAHLLSWAAGDSPAQRAAAGWLSLREQFLRDFGLYRLAWNDHRILWEAPARVTDEARRNLERDLDALLSGREQRARARAELEAALPARLGKERWQRLERELSVWRKAYLVRDDHGHYIDARAGGYYRRACLLAGERLKERGLLAEAGGFNFLLRDELRRALTGELKNARRLADGRKRLHEEQQNLCAPEFIGRPPSGGGESAAADDKTAGRGPDQTVFKGRSGTASRVRGEVRFKKDIPGINRGKYIFVFKDVREIDFSTILHCAAGLVFEQGSPFEHVGIWARENDIPALFGAAGAAEALETGDSVELDGAREELRLIRRAGERNNDDEDDGE